MRRVSLGAAAVLGLLPLALTGSALFTGRILAPVDLAYAAEPLASVAAEHGVEEIHNFHLSDLYSQMIPWRHAVRDAVAQGTWPLWNPYMLCGDVLAAAAQPAPYHPLQLLGFLLPLATSLTFHTAAVLLLAALAAFLWLRDLGCGEPASLFGATAWTYSSFLMFWHGWPLGVAVATFPLVLLGVWRTVRSPGPAAGLLLTVALGLTLLAGHPQTAAQIVVAGGLLGAGALLVRQSPQPLRSVAWGSGAGALAFGLCAVFVLPILEALPQTFEWHYRRDIYALSPRGLPVGEVVERLRLHAIPFLFGTPGRESIAERADWLALSAYSGSLLFAPVLYALWRIRRPAC